MQGICCLRVYSFNLIHIPVLIIEHNIEFISHVADYLVDVGRNAGNKGGETIIQGKPIEVVRNVELSWNNTLEIGTSQRYQQQISESGRTRY